MRVCLCILTLFLAGVTIAAPVPAPLRRSQNFTVVDVRPMSLSLPGRLRSASAQDLVQLDADVLLLSSERIRDALISELDYSSEHSGKIRLYLFAASKPDEVVRVISSHSPEGWEYQVEIPDQIESLKLTRAIVHVVLLEMANRGQGPRSGELPLWLVEGLTSHLISVMGPDLVVRSVPLGSMLRIVRVRKGLDYLQQARDVLRANAPLSFAELAYPTPGTLVGQRLLAYQSACQLFVYELLHSPDGAAHLLEMLRALPACWNWETALLRAFSTQFSRMLDVEKKWSVDVLAFTARDPSQVWSRVDCLDRLEQVLAVPSQIRVTPDMLPQRTTLSLRQVISHWDFAAQIQVLRPKLSMLEALRFHSPPDLVPLIDSYRRAIATYLQKRELAARPPENRMQGTLNASLVAQDAIKDLEELEKRRASLRPENILSVNSPRSR